MNARANDHDARWLAEATRLAEQNVRDGGGPFGAILVRDSEVIATGVNRVTRDNDPSAHAEVVAIRTAGAALGTFNLEGCVLYSSCEPCPMCAATSLWARLDRVVFAADRQDAAAGGFDDLLFYRLFEDQSLTWPTPVTQHAIPTAIAPFTAWLANTDRVDY